MRRKEREVAEMAEIFDILSRCDTVRIGIRGDKFPYVVPVTPAVELADGKAVVYFHCAKEGRKLDLLRAHPEVCVEGDIFIRIEKTAHGITTRYESVIGFGRCEFLEDEGEILRVLRLLTDQYGYPGYALEDCKSLSHVLVGKIVLDEITGKRNLPQGTVKK